MSQPAPCVLESVERLRQEFDSGFARELVQHSERQESLLAITCGTNSYALRLSEVAALRANQAITELPGASAGLLGVTAFRASVAAVYDLRGLLGLPALAPCRWLVLARADPTVALAFDDFEGQLLVPLAAIVDVDVQGDPASPVEQAVSSHGRSRPILAVPKLISTIKAPVGAQS